MTRYLLSPLVHISVLFLFFLGFAWRGAIYQAQRTHIEAMLLPSSYSDLKHIPFRNLESSTYDTQSIWFDTTLSRAALIAFYHERLIHDGWRVLDTGMASQSLPYTPSDINAAYETTVTVWPFSTVEYIVTIYIYLDDASNQSVSLDLHRR